MLALVRVSLCVVLSSCAADTDRVETIGRVETEALREISGMVASRQAAGVLWTHNDSGDGARLYALSTSGELLATVRLQGVVATDWEDLAIAPVSAASPSIPSTRRAEDVGAPPSAPNAWHLYVADTGDNDRRRREVEILRIREPEVPRSAESSTRTPPPELPSGKVERFRFRFEDGPVDCEALVAHVARPELWLFSKESSGATVYRLSVAVPRQVPLIAERVARVDGARWVTGADWSRDASRLVLRVYWGLCEFELGRGGTLPDALRGRPSRLVTLLERQGEAVCYDLDSRSILTLSEGAHMPIHRISRKESP